MTANHIARMTAKRLMPTFGDPLALTVEQVIQSALAAISALIVQCAQLAFDLRRTNGGGGEKLDKEWLRHELRLELGLPEGVSESPSSQLRHRRLQLQLAVRCALTVQEHNRPAVPHCTRPQDSAATRAPLFTSSQTVSKRVYTMGRLSRAMLHKLAMDNQGDHSERRCAGRIGAESQGVDERSP